MITPSHFSIIIFSSIAISAFFFFQRRRLLNSSYASSEGVGVRGTLANGLFESDESDPIKKIEVAMAALADKFCLRAGILLAHEESGCSVLAVVSNDYALKAGISCGANIQKDSVFCGKIGDGGRKLVAIDYASLTEWKRHSACVGRGWESYIGVSCGILGQRHITLGFFDTVPRANVFSKNEKALLEQMAPWVFTVLDSYFGAPRESNGDRSSEARASSDS